MRLPAVLVASTFLFPAFAVEANPDPVVVAIDAAIQSLRSERPLMFVQATCSSTGLSVTNTGGGTGLSVSAIGGGPGSQTTGMTVTNNGGGCDVEEMAGEAISKIVDPQVAQGIQLLTEIKSIVQGKIVDKDVLARKISGLRQLRYLPPSIASITDAVAKTKLH